MSDSYKESVESLMKIAHEETVANYFDMMEFASEVTGNYRIAVDDESDIKITLKIQRLPSEI